MRRFYVRKENIFDDYLIIDEQDHFHLSSVLRLNEGETIECFCGDGIDYVCEINKINKKNTRCNIISKKTSQKTPKINITLFQGVTKGDKLDLIVQKATELGISKIVFFKSEYTSRKMGDCKIEKLKTINIEACKQCGRSDNIKIEGLLTFKQVIDSLKNYEKVLFAYEKQDRVKWDIKSNNVALIVGSEGGFSEEEVKMLKKIENVQTISMGNRILRSETAAIALTAVVMYELGEWQ